MRAAVAVLALLPCLAWAEVRVLPGSSRAISPALSATRDSGTMAMNLSPYSALTAGIDSGLVGYEAGRWSTRLGFFGLLELESNRPFDPKEEFRFPFPPAGLLWRGATGFSLAVADATFFPWGPAEAVVSVRHESEHFTGDRDGNDGQFKDVPIVGDFVMPEVATRIRQGELEVDVRYQHKLYAGNYRAYSHGPGLDFIVRWRRSGWTHPFVALFGERVFGNELVHEGRTYGVPDTWLLRALAGVAVPGAAGDLQVYTSLAAGHGKGLLAFRKEVLWGGGVRIALTP